MGTRVVMGGSSVWAWRACLAPTRSLGRSAYSLKHRRHGASVRQRENKGNDGWARNQGHGGGSDGTLG